MISSVTSQGSISNFVAQTPKNSRLSFNNFKKNHKQPTDYVDQNKENVYARSNGISLPYKMIESQMPQTCINHQGKQCSYYIESEQDGQLIFYCEKCAILVASQGFYVMKISEFDKNSSRKSQNADFNNEGVSLGEVKTTKKSIINERIRRQNKEKQLTTFLNILERNQHKIDKLIQKQSLLMEKLRNSKSQALNSLQKTFTQLYQALNTFQQNQIGQINKKYTEIQNQITMEMQRKIKYQNLLEGMREDICQTYDQIISLTTDEEFQTVMGAYQSNIDTVDVQLGQQQSKLAQKNSLFDRKINSVFFNAKLEQSQLMAFLQNQIRVSKCPQQNHIPSAQRRQSMRSTSTNRRRMSMLSYRC